VNCFCSTGLLSNFHSVMAVSSWSALFATVIYHGLRDRSEYPGVHSIIGLFRVAENRDKRGRVQFVARIDSSDILV
jgi:hypothetical protein